MRSVAANKDIEEHCTMHDDRKGIFPRSSSLSPSRCAACVTAETRGERFDFGVVFVIARGGGGGGRSAKSNDASPRAQSFIQSTNRRSHVLLEASGGEEIKGEAIIVPDNNEFVNLTYLNSDG